MLHNHEHARQVARALLEVGAVTFRPQKPFQWASGWLSPIYCDNRIILGYPKWREVVNDGLYRLVQARFPRGNAIAGVATAGIPQASMLAYRMGLPLAYVRDRAKQHGKQNRIEGALPEGARVVVIEDLISTGGSSAQAVDALRERGYEVEGLLAIFSYGFEVARQTFAQRQLAFEVLTHWETLISCAREEGHLSEADETTLAAWRANPEGWRPSVSPQ